MGEPIMHRSIGNSHRALVVTGLLAFVVSATASSADLSSDPHQWGIETDASAPIASATPYRLANERVHSRLGYRHRTFGVDLGWTASGDWEFRGNPGQRPGVVLTDHRIRRITSGEAVAMYNTTARKYLVHGEPTWGIGLDWESRPSYQWKVDRAADGMISLYNTVQGDYLVYGDGQGLGITLWWLQDYKKYLHDSDLTGIKSASVALAAQPPVSGPIPYLGSFGGILHGRLISVQNAANNVILRFIKPGHSSTECDNPSSVVPIGPMKTMTPDETKAAFGTATPPVPATFLVCVVSDPLLSTVWVNITYQLD